MAVPADTVREVDDSRRRSEGVSMPPPAARAMRKVTSQLVVGARLHRADPVVTSARPTWKIRRRPTRSAVAPARVSSEAGTRG
ncbi:hypothetical protein BG418_19560 [Streptomyces sp. CBMA152]|nr:hypothetical protein [Streptomyces sp. CBMA152]